MESSGRAWLGGIKTVSPGWPDQIRLHITGLRYDRTGAVMSGFITNEMSMVQACSGRGWLDVLIIKSILNYNFYAELALRCQNYEILILLFYNKCPQNDVLRMEHNQMRYRVLCLLRQRISKIKFPMKIQNIVQIFFNFSKFVNLKAIIKRISRKFQLIESKL